MKLHIRKADDNQWYFTLNGRNGKVIMTSETYKRIRSVNKQVDKLALALNAQIVNDY